MSKTLEDMNVGDVVKIKENSTLTNFIIVQKGNPDTSMYDSSCNGIWLLREQAHSKIPFNNINSNDYENSSLRAWLDSEYLNRIDSKIRAVIKQVKIPFKKGDGRAESGVQSGSSGLSCKVFLLSGYEVGYLQANNAGIPIDGAKLSYFIEGTGTDANNKRIGKQADGSTVMWWLRSQYVPYLTSQWCASATGIYGSKDPQYTDACARPAFILPSSLFVDSSGLVLTNTSPTITIDKSGSLGTLTSGFTVKYSVNDTDTGDTLTVREYLDGTQKKSFTATRGTNYTIDYTGSNWTALSKASHTIKVTVSDGTETVEKTITFTRGNNAPTISANKSGNLGTLTDGFDVNYSVNDMDGDSLTVTETIDSRQIRQYPAVLGRQESCSVRGEDWLKITGGTHTFKIAASDGLKVSECTVTFTRNCTGLSIKPLSPMEADDVITACSLKVIGSIPFDAATRYRVTNNALDDEPVWEECTNHVKSGLNYLFGNKTANNGFAFSFDIAIDRGLSGLGGYITEISGGFE